jgi:branched-chain amino acid transport system ATP-binding protein
LIHLNQLIVGWNGNPAAGPVSLDLGPGESLLILGHNGAGKSTLLLTLFGLLPSISGTGTVLGQPLSSVSPKSLLSQGVRFLGQGIRAFPDLTVRRSRSLLVKLYGWDQRQTLELPELPSPDPQLHIGNLSVGQRRLEALRLLSAGNPRLFLLDEPTAGTDPGTAGLILAWIGGMRKRGAQFVIIEHDFHPLLKHLESALILQAGRVSYFGKAAELDEKLLAERYL